MKPQNLFLLAAMASLLLVIGCESSATRQTEKNKRLFVQGVDAINDRNWSALDDLIAPDYIRHCQATPDVKLNSLEDFKQFLKQDAATFPDSRMTIQHLIAEGNLVAFYCTYVGTQKGRMGPFPPSDKKMSLEFAGVHRVENGKLAETWLTWDNLAALTQLGHFPPQQPTE
jgi:steroid delta-isomerase-like uncharacterized protein